MSASSIALHNSLLLVALSLTVATDRRGVVLDILFTSAAAGYWVELIIMVIKTGVV
jgi:hypothetical protein